MLSSVLAAYGLTEEECTIRSFGSGLINRTWKITDRNGKEYILQHINQEVFRQPRLIAENIDALATFLQQHFPEYLFVRPVNTRKGDSLVCLNEKDWFRLLPFVSDSHTIDVVEDPELAYEAARQFGKFTKLLSAFPVETLHDTLPDFHNLSLRCQGFETALQTGNPSRIREAAPEIAILRQFYPILKEFEQILHHPGFRRRVTHHDTKISNVLFDGKGKGLCVIDLDTVMPGYFISDLGDMMRTYLSPVSEEEKDLSLISIREEYFLAIIRGYLSEMKEELSTEEIQHVVYAGKFMIFMQAIRFLADHLNNDVYYGARYEGHNLVRARNQITLLQRLTEKEAVLHNMVMYYPGSLV